MDDSSDNSGTEEVDGDSSCWVCENEKESDGKKWKTILQIVSVRAVKKYFHISTMTVKDFL